LIQTNATINPGNSGGPLLNINGELIGINVALRDGAQGIAFALNADLVQQVLCKHLSASRVAGVQHGMGCQEAPISETEQRQRVVVRAVAEFSPAASAGLRRGDEIVYVAARKVGNCFDVERALFDCRPGECVDVTVLRDGNQLSVSLALGTGLDRERILAYPTRHPNRSAVPTGR
jgi:serine protease Do